MTEPDDDEHLIEGEDDAEDERLERRRDWRTVLLAVVIAVLAVVALCLLARGPVDTIGKWLSEFLHNIA